MSKSTMALVITWIVISIAAAAYLGYYFGKKNGQNQCQDKEGSTIKTDNLINPTNASTNTTGTSNSSPSVSSSANSGQKTNTGNGNVNNTIVE